MLSSDFEQITEFRVGLAKPVLYLVLAYQQSQQEPAGIVLKKPDKGGFGPECRVLPQKAEDLTGRKGRLEGLEERVSLRPAYPQPPIPIDSNNVATARVGGGSWQLLCCQKVLLASLMGTRLRPASREVGNMCREEPTRRE